MVSEGMEAAPGGLPISLLLDALDLDAEALVIPKRVLVSLCSQSCGRVPWISGAWIFLASRNFVVYPRPTIDREKKAEI